MKLSSKQKAAVKKAIKIARTSPGLCVVEFDGGEARAVERGGRIHWDVWDGDTCKFIAEGAVS